MNYRHAFHAGNFADVFKHVLLSRILTYLARKPAPFRYIDTHSGIGRYDLSGDEATRTGEWRDGIARLAAAPRPPAIADLLAPYLDAVGPIDSEGRPFVYPGSPAIAQALLRPDDRMLLAELHPEDAGTLRRAMGRDKRVKILERDGYAVLNAALPPPERRGLVLIDPPFEDRDEFPRLVEALAQACRKWATGVYAVWYPIKAPAPLATFHQSIRERRLPPCCLMEFQRDAADTTLRGCGLLVVNPPFVLVDEARRLLPFLAEALRDPAAAPWHGRVEDWP